MGDILDRISNEILTDDIEHTWEPRTSNPGMSTESSMYEAQLDNMNSQFLKDGYTLIKQSQPFKGIRFGGKSILDKDVSLSTGLNLALSTATRDTVQENLNKLVEEVFFGSSDDDSAEDSVNSGTACGSVGAEGKFDGNYWMGEMKLEWLENTTAKGLVQEGEYGQKIIETANKYAPAYEMAPARCIAQVMMEGGWYKHTRDTTNPWGCRGIGQFKKTTWTGVCARAVKKFPELASINQTWDAPSSSGGAGHPVLGVVCMMDYMYNIHIQHMEKALPGKDDDFWWSALGYLMGPSRPATILKNTGGDRLKADEEAKKVIPVGNMYHTKGVAFYGNGMLEKWAEYSEQVPKSDRRPQTDIDKEESTSNVCDENITISGDITSTVSWTPGQEIANFAGKESDQMWTTSYGVPSGIKTGQPWMKGTGTHGSHIEFDAAFRAAANAAKKDGHIVFMGPGAGTFRSYEYQVTLKQQKPTLAATPGKSIHGIGYATDIVGKENSGGTGASKAAKQWLRTNGGRFGIFAPIWTSMGEDWHWQLHPDLCYSLKQMAEARGGKWD